MEDNEPSIIKRFQDNLKTSNDKFIKQLKKRLRIIIH